MAYPQGINFRDTLGFVTDGANEDAQVRLGDGLSSYPWTTAQGNNVGWEQSLNIGSDHARDRNSGNDRRLAGIQYNGNTNQCDFRFDLPSTGDYKIGLSAGDASYSTTVSIELLDTTTSLGTLASGSTGAANSFKDATDTIYTAAAWPGSNTLVTKTFATTICRFRLASGATYNITHAYVEVASVTLYLRNTQVNDLGATYYDMLTTAGAASDTAVVNATLAGTEIQLTKTAGGAIAQWVSGKVPAGGFTLTSADISIWAKEDADLTNVGGRFRLFRRQADGTETELAGGPFDDGVEFTTTDAEYTWSGNATDTAFIEGDRVLLKLYITNIGVMAIGTATLTFNAAAAATGDSFLSIFPSVVFGGGNFSGGSFSGAVGGFSVDAVAGDGQGLFWPANLDGIGTGGPFLGHSVH